MSEFIPPPGAIVSTDKEQVDFIPPKGAIVSVEEPLVTAETSVVEDTELASEDVSLDKLSEYELKNIKSAFDQGIFKMAEREAFDKYKETGEIDVNLLPKKVEDKVGFIQDKLARLARGTASTAKGFEEFKTSLLLTGTDIAMDVFKPELTNEQKLQSLKVLKGVRDASSGIEGYDKVIEGLGDYVREYDSESITDDISKAIETKDLSLLAQAADRAVGGVFESAPSLALAYLGTGGLIALGTSAAGNKFDEEFEENPEEGTKRLFLNSVASGTAEATFELVTRRILGRATGLMGSGNKKAAKELIDNYSTKLIKRIATDPLAEGVSEAATELTVDLIDLATLKSAGKFKEAVPFTKEFDESDFYSRNWKKWSDAGIIGTVTGGGIVTTRALTSDSKAVRDAAEYTLTPESDKKIINDAAIEINSLNEDIKKANNKEEVSDIENLISEQERKIINTRQKVSEELNMMNPNELKKYAEGIDNVARERKKLNSVFSPILKTKTKEQIDELQYQNDQVLRESVDRRLNENIKTVGVKDLGRTVNDYDSPKDYQKAYDNTEFGKKNSMNVTSSDGFIDTEGDIYINKEVAQKVRNVNVPAHELLHGILDNNIKEPGQLKRLVTEFKAILPKEVADLIQKRIDDNYRFTTDEQGNKVEKPESEYMQEYFTAFADLIGNRKVKFNENIFAKVGEKITPIFKGKGYGHIKFETGKDVYDFIESYQKQIAKGELKPETIKAAKKVSEQDIKMSKTASDNVQKIYEDQGIGGALDIIEEFKPIVNKIVQRRSEAPNFDRQLLTDEIETGKRGLLELIQDYNVESGVPLAAYINKFLPARAIEASKRVLGETFEEDISQRVDIAAPEVEVEIKPKEEKVPRSLRKKLNIEKGSDLYNKVKDAVVKTFGTKLPEVTDPKFKKSLSDSYKRELKKEVNALMGTRSDFKMFVTNNAETLYKSIPQETINKRFQAFSEPVLDKEGKQLREKTAVGKGVFKKKPFNKEEFINYFLGKDVGASTKGTRKTALSETIADEMALDATMEVIEDPKVFEKFKEIQEIEGKEVPKDIKPKISEKVKRPEGFKFSKTEDFKNITEDLSDDKVEEVSRLLEDVDSNVGLSSDSQILKDQVKEIVDIAYPEKLKGKAKIVNELVKYLKPLTRQISKFKDIKINIENYIKSLVSDNVINNYGKAFGIKNLTEVFRTKNKEQRAFLKLNAKEMLKLKDENGNLIYKNPLDLAAVCMQYKAMMEDGSANPSRAMTFYTEATGIYKTKAEAQAAIDSSIDGLGKIRKIEDSKGNITGYQVGGDHTKSFIKNFISPVFSEESNPITDVKVIGGTKTNPKEQVEFTYKNGDKKLVDSPRRAKQEVTQDMIDNKVSKKELDKREFDANRAFNFVVNQYKAAKILLDKKLATNENIAMLAAGMGANMKGPIRAAAMLRYLPVNSKYKKLRKSTGGKAFEYEHGIPAVIVNLAIADAVLNPKSEVDLKKLQESYTVGIIDVDFNDNFGRFFKARMPFSYKIGDLPITRWYNEFTTGGDVHALYDLKENKIVGKEEAKLWQEIQKAKASNVQTLSNNVISFSKTSNNQDIIGYAKTIDEALRVARNPNASIKKIRVFDFDDTLATTKSDVLFTAPDGTEGKLNAEEFAKKGSQLLEEGYVFDFSEFNKVTKGKPGPLLDIAKKIQAARGTEDVFVLTARAPEAQVAIKEFLDSVGLNIPLENITGLGNSTGAAKAKWMVEKAAEGYNDFYFADDAYQNVKAVKDAMSVLDVKSKVQQAKFSKSKNISSDFNKLIEESTGIGAEKVFSDVKAQVRGAKAKRQRFFIPPSAEDMLGLVYTTLGKGKKGEAHLKFYQENLFDPYTKAMENLSTDRVNLMADFKALKKQLDVPKDLRKTTESGFTNEQAVRVYLWNKMGEKIPGLSKSDLKELNDIVENNPKLKVFADQILSITKGDGYSKPKDSWAVGTITTDLIDVLNTKKRGKYLETWKQNKDLIYSKENLNKLEAAYGPKYRAALENSLRRMESGSNRLGGGNRLSNQVLDYINNSTGAIMFFNTRSAILQTLSAANFVNWSFNNPFKAGKAFANQPQYWKDFVELMNSDYLVDRRNGLKLNINESEIANAAKTSGNKAKAALNYILEKGYAPTKYADSFAIASGGATFYRNRINDLIKNEGKTEAEAKEIAMKEFRQVSEISQQSSDPSKISQQQSSDLGRIVLQFANTPMQYARIQKRAVQDIINKRGDLKTNISKIAYYGFLQNMIFNGLQQGLFALGFGDDEIDEKEEGKLIKAANGMLDSSLRGLGMAGVTVQVLKNLGIDIYDRSKRDRPEYSDSYKKLLEFSPAVKSKLGKFQSAAYPFDSKTRRAEVFEKGFSLDNPAYESMAKVVTGTTNLPLDRMYSKVNNLSAAMDQETETWQSVAMVLGWPEWQIKGKKSNKDEKKVVSKEQAKKDLEKKLGVKFL